VPGGSSPQLQTPQQGQQQGRDELIGQTGWQVVSALMLFPSYPRDAARGVTIIMEQIASNMQALLALAVGIGPQVMTSLMEAIYGAGMSWWREALIYQIYPRSFADSDGDGVGDLQGIIARLDHVAWLGVDAIWLNPTTPSPNTDWGYDVSDFCGVDPALGTLADLDELIATARDRSIRVLLDLVPNHTSSQHPWFLDARTSRTSVRRDHYVWADEPNNWISVFGGPAWTLDEASGQHYLHNFLPAQPDLNWWSEAVREEFDRILRFWFDRGISGFRIDVAHGIVKDAELRDNPPAEPGDPPDVQRVGQRTTYNMNRPEAHDVLRRFRSVCEAYPDPPLLLGETFVEDVATLATFYGADADELQLAFNFPMVQSDFGPAMKEIVAETEALLPPGAWPVWTGSNHDVGRLATRWAGGDPHAARCALMMLLTLRGTPVLYYGDEIGLTDVAIPREQLRDPVGLRYWPHTNGRDVCRTPMPWTPDAGAGFTVAGVEPWLPMGDPAACNVASQRSDPASTLTLVRDLVALRRSRPDLHAGSYTVRPSPDQAWVFARGDTTTVALNLGPEPCVVGLPAGQVCLGTDRRRDGELLTGKVRLGGYEGLVVALRP
jgi:alpha-glucosidase